VKDITLIMESKKRVCSNCGEAGHNKRSCPEIPIEDTFKPIEDTFKPLDGDEEVVEERIELSKKRELLISDLLDRQSYDIPIDIFKLWLPKRTCCRQNEVKHILNMGLNKDSVILYLELAELVEELY
jgi:hypothetical protein